ncbi:hypothetical protein E6P09_08085 [Haloferax mediterranei ATCC 33500]|nr:hypothetical protein [Haloferax mediterranei]AHZ21905.1 hypothetical protein BM92_04170 [Haloferax mediterranei ATCC 33500]MDX5988823.1 hypothetical protein [Haloferax mediterranei ATCC 33500]QCQ76620.1 hypothetical protein E6P09_08085 [Haloferax mediterranei ATCC 33500]
MATASALPRPTRASLLKAAFAVNTTLILTFVYLLATEATVGAPRYALYGVLWVAVGLWVLFDIDVAPASTATKRKAAAIAIGYFVLLAVAGGLVTGPVPGGSNGVRVSFLPPGWGPALIYGGDLFNLILMPARVVGYAALAFLVYDTVVEAAGAAVSGIVGLFSCVSCSWPLLASLVTSVFGSGTAIAATVTTLSYDLSTLVFLVTVVLLRWRPGFGR